MPRLVRTLSPLAPSRIPRPQSTSAFASICYDNRVVMTIWLRSTESTMRDAANLAARGEAHGTIVVADEQTAGIGRHGHSWHSEIGAGLYVSIVLRLPDAVPVLMLALGLAARDAIVETTGLRPDLRWPNDVLLGGLKCAGVLALKEGDAV